MDLLTGLHIILYWVIYQFKQIFPYWIAGVIAGSLISVFLAARITSLAGRINSEKYGILAIIPAALIGAASPICMYGTVPLIASLGRKGAHQYLLCAFMVSSILINPNLFIFSFALGAHIAFIRLFLCILAGVLAGLLAKTFFRNMDLFNLTGFEETKKRNNCVNHGKRLLSDINRAIVKTGPYFLFGILLTVLYDCYFPKDLIVNLFGPDKGFGVLTAASLGIPVYVCGGGTIPLLKAWLEVGMSPGSAMAFMITGPATKITNLGAVKIILGMRNFIIYIFFNIVFAVAAGLATNLFYGMSG